MEVRQIDKPGAAGYRAMLGVEKFLAQCSIEKPLRELIKLHVSQINGCAYCIDMHWKDARAAGESEQRLYGLPAWRESPYYSERERAGLRFAEELTRIADHPVPEDVHEQVREQFDDQPTKVIKAGETFYEPAGCLHRVSRNPGDVKTRLIAVVLHPRDAKEIAVPESKND